MPKKPRKRSASKQRDPPWERRHELVHKIKEGFFNHTDEVTHPGPLQFFVNHQIYEIQFPAHLPQQTCERPPTLNCRQKVSHEHELGYPLQ